MTPAARRPLLVLALVLAAGVAWVALLPELSMPSGLTAAAAPSGATGPDASSSPSPSASADPGASASASAPATTPTPTPIPLPMTIEARRTALSTALGQLRAKYGIPGVSAVMTFPDGSSWIGTSGLANVATHRMVTARTAFAAGSISKTFTAALIMTLVEEGSVSLDAPVRTYLPRLVIDPAITVRQLLDHTSGLDDFFSHSAIDAALLANPRRVWTAAASIRFVGKPYFPPGTGWHYSNTNYLVLGMLAEAVGHAPLAVQLRRRFFDPLGMDHTIYQSVERPRGATAHGYRFRGSDPRLKGIDVSDGTAVIPFTSVVTAAGGAGSIATTASDLATWARALYSGDVVRPESLAAMIDDSAVTTALKSSVPYGLGVQVVTIDGRRALGHSGRLLGFRAVMRYLPDDGIAVVVMTNQSRTDPGLLVRDLLRTVLGVPPLCPGCPQRP